MNEDTEYKQCSTCGTTIKDDALIIQCDKCKSIDHFKEYLEGSGCLI